MNPAQIIEKIAELQSTGNRRYLPGLFPSQRAHQWVPYLREDNNIFFSSLIAYSLLELKPHLDNKSQALAQSIIETVRAAQPYYQNWKGQSTYNFWRSNPSRHFPNGWLLHHFQRYALPDDSDDSCLVHLTNSFSQAQHQSLKDKLEHHYEADSPPATITPAVYGKLRAYPTFFGKKMAWEMDACVVANVMCFTRDQGYPWSSRDEDSLKFLEEVLTRKHYLSRPFDIAPNYNHSLVILYHITRLVTRYPHPKFQKLGLLLKGEVLQYPAGRSRNFVERMILNICRMRLGLDPLALKIPQQPHIQLRAFSFFQAGMLTAFQNSWLTALSRKSFFHLKFHCEAYGWTLFLEHQIYSRQFTPTA